MSAGMYARHIGVGHLQAGENRYFQALHEVRFIIGLVVIAKEVEKAMNRKMRKVMPKGLVLGHSFACRRLIRDDDVAKMMRRLPSVAGCREGQDVRWFVLAAPIAVQGSDRR